MESNTETYTKTFSIDVERANYHLKCKKRKRKRIILVIVIWAFVFAYLFSSLSKVNLSVSGNVYYTKQELMNMAYISKNSYWWLLDTDKAKKVLESYEYIEGVKFSKSFFGVKLEIEEIYPIAVKDGKYVMSNAQVDEKSVYELNSKVGFLTNFDSVDNEDLASIVNKYKDIKLDVRRNFSSIEIVRDSNSYGYVKIYGSDEKIGNFIIKVDLVYLNTKFNKNKYGKIIEEVSKNNVKYSEDEPALIAYHYLDEEEFQLVEMFEEE